MKTQTTKVLEIIIESINYIIINYALTNMAFLFKTNILYVLFFASEAWILSTYWQKMKKLTENNIISAVLLVGCFVAHIGMIYFIGRISGEIVPFRT